MYPPSLLLVPNVNVSIIRSLRKSEYLLEVSAQPLPSVLEETRSTLQAPINHPWICQVTPMVLLSKAQLPPAPSRVSHPLSLLQ
jgi:hypothetical protein